jgi:hypothetical protein
MTIRLKSARQNLDFPVEPSLANDRPNREQGPLCSASLSLPFWARRLLYPQTNPLILLDSDFENNRIQANGKNRTDSVRNRLFIKAARRLRAERPTKYH